MLDNKKLQEIRDKILGVTVDRTKYGDLNSTVYLQQIRDALLSVSPARVDGNLAEHVYLQQILNAKRGVADGQFGSMSNEIYLQQILNAFNGVADGQFGSLPADAYLDLLVSVAGPSNINVLCPVITPTLNGELLTNGNMETGDPPSNWTGVTAILDGVADERTGGAGVQSISIVNNGVNFGEAYQGITSPVGTWIRVSGYRKVVTVLHGIYLATATGSVIRGIVGSGAGWVQRFVTGRLTGANGRVRLFNEASTNGVEARDDDVSAQALTFSTCMALLGTAPTANGTYICNPTIPGQANSATCVGLVLRYNDDNNLLVIYIDGSKAFLDQCNGGTWSNLRNGNITYIAGKPLKLVVNGTTAALYYNNIQVGANATITAGNLGLRVLGFNTFAGNTVGQVTMNP